MSSLDASHLCAADANVVSKARLYYADLSSLHFGRLVKGSKYKTLKNVLQQAQWKNIFKMSDDMREMLIL